jgi:hypothetical protein
LLPRRCRPETNVIKLRLFAIDFNEAHNITPLFVTIRQTAENIDDTRMLAGSEAYHADLTFYNAVKRATEDDVPGAKSVYEALKVRFLHVRRNRDGEEIAE